MFKFDFESYEKQGGDRTEAVNYLKSLKTDVDLDILEQKFNEKNTSNSDFYDLLKYGNFSYTQHSKPEKVNKKSSEPEWLDDEKKAFQKAQSAISYSKDKQKAELEKQKAIKDYKNFYTKAGEFGGFIDNLSSFFGGLPLKINEALFDKDVSKGSEYLEKDIRKKIKDGALFDDLSDIEKKHLSLNISDKDFMEFAKNDDEYKNIGFFENNKRASYLENENKKALAAYQKEKQRADIFHKDIKDLTIQDLELIQDDNSYTIFGKWFDNAFKSKEEQLEDFKKDYESSVVIADEILSSVTRLKNIHQSSNLFNILFASDETNSTLRDDLLLDLANIAQLHNFDDVGLDEKQNIYFIKQDEEGKEQFYRLDERFFTNFFTHLDSIKMELGFSLAGGIYGFKKGLEKALKKGKISTKTPIEALIYSTIYSALGAFGGAGGDYILNNLKLNRENDFKEFLAYALQAGTLDLTAGTAISTIQRLGFKGIGSGLKNTLSKITDYAPILNFAKNIPTQNIKAATELLDLSYNQEQKEALKDVFENIGAKFHSSDTTYLNEAKEALKAKYGENSLAFKSVNFMSDLFNQNSLKAKQNMIIDLIRSDTSGQNLAFLLESAKLSPKANANLKNVLNLTTANLNKELEKLSLNKGDIKLIFDELEKGTKESFDEAMNGVLAKIYDDTYKIVIDKAPYENLITKLNDEKLVLSENDKLISQSLINALFDEKGLNFTQLINLNKNLNAFYKKIDNPNFKSYLKNEAHSLIKNIIKENIDKLFAQNKTAYVKAKNLFETAMSDYSTMKEILKEVDNLGLRAKKTTEKQALDKLFKYLQGQGEQDLSNFAFISKNLSEANKEILELNLLKNLFEKSLIGSKTKGLEVFDSTNFLNNLEKLSKGEALAQNELKNINANEALEMITHLNGEKIPQNVDIQSFLKSLDEIENKENFIEHLKNSPDAQKRLQYLNLVEPTLKNADLELTRINNNALETKEFIKVFELEDKSLFYLVISPKDNNKMLLTAFPTTKIRQIQKRINEATSIKARDLGVISSARSYTKTPTPDNIIPQNSPFQTQKAQDFIKLIKAFHTLFNQDAKIALSLNPALTQKGNFSGLTADLSAKAKYMLASGVWNNIILRNLNPHSIAGKIYEFIAGRGAIGGNALRYHIKKALERSVSVDDFKQIFNQRVKKAAFNSKTKEALKEFSELLEQGNKDLEQEIKQIINANEDLQTGKNTLNDELKSQLKEHLQNLPAAKVPDEIDMETFLKSLDEFENKENFIEHLKNKNDSEARLKYLNLVEPTFTKADFEFEKLENGVLKQKRIKKFTNGKDFFYLLATKDDDKILLTGFKTDKINTILKEFENLDADIIRTFIQQGSKQDKARLGLPDENILTQKNEFLEKIEQEKQERLQKELELKQRQKEQEFKRLEEIKQKRQQAQALKDKKLGAKANSSIDLSLNQPVPYTPLKDTKLIINDDEQVNLKYVVVKKDDLKENFTQKGTQGRLIKNETKIKKIRLNFKPELMFEREGSFEGVPIIAKDGQIISGNHRIAGLKALSKQSLEKYKTAAKERFNTELKDDELIVRLYESEDLDKIKNLSLQSNVGLESTLGEKSLSVLAKYEPRFAELPPFIKAESVSEAKAIIARVLDKESKGLNEKEANLALLSHLARTTSNNDISQALDNVKNLDLEQRAKLLNMYIDNASGFYNLAKDTSLKKLFLENHINDAIVASAKSSGSRMADFNTLIKDLEHFNSLESHNKELALQMNENQVKNYVSQALGYAFARFSRLENPSASLFKFLKNIKGILENRYTGGLFDENNKALSDLDIFDFLKELLTQGQENRKAFGLIDELEKIKPYYEFEALSANVNQIMKKDDEFINTDEIFKNLENSSNFGKNMYIIGAENLNEKLIKWLLEKNKRAAINKLDKEKAKEFDFKYPDDVRRTIGADEIRHTLNKHGENSNNVKKSGQIPVDEKDIANYQKLSDEANEKLKSLDNDGHLVEVSFKQVNGFFIVVEQMRNKNNEFSFKTLYKEKGNYKDSEIYKKTALKAQTLSQGYKPSANSFTFKAKDIIPENEKVLQDMTFKDDKGKEHILTKEVQELWLNTFNLKSIDEAFVPEFSDEVQEALQKAGVNASNFKVNQKDLEKIIIKGRQKYIKEIQPTFKEPDIVFKDEKGDIIFAKNINQKLYFANITRLYDDEFLNVSLSPKKEQSIKNKLAKAQEIYYNKTLAPELRDSSAHKASTGVLSSTSRAN